MSPSDAVDLELPLVKI